MTWLSANRHYLEMQLERLRLLLHRRVLWLRTQWRPDPLQNYQGLVISDAHADQLLAREGAAAEAEFYVRDDRAHTLDAARAEIETTLDRECERMAADGHAPALDSLAQLLNLNAFEQDVLLLCLAPELESRFATLYAYVQDEVSARLPTPQLALDLFTHDDDSRLAGRSAFMPHAPLRRWRLVELDLSKGSLLSSPMRLDESLQDLILGLSHPDARLSDVLEPVSPAPLASSHVKLVEQLQAWLESQVQTGAWRGLNLVGPPGVGKRALAHALCARVGLQLAQLDPTRLPPAGTERRDWFRLLAREALLSQLAIYIDATTLDLADKTVVGTVNQILEYGGAFVLLASRERRTSTPGLMAVQIERPDAPARRALWIEAFKAQSLSPDGILDALVEQFQPSPSDLGSILASAKGHARLRGEVEADMTPRDVWTACREQARAAMDDLAQRLVPCHTWDDLVLPPDVMNPLREVAAQVAQRALVYETWGWGAKLNRGRGISALFAGPSGVGKTMAAEVLAQALDLDLYRIDLSSVVSKYIGETEKNLRRVFDAAEQSGAILFFDEADALFGKRSEVKDSHDRYANIEINYLLQRMEDYRGLAVLATNMKSQLDSAFLRRLRFLIDFPFPDAGLRRQIWQGIFPRTVPVEGLDYNLLARLDLSGGNIKNIAVNAAFLAAAESSPVCMKHLLGAARREYAKLDRLLPEGDLFQARVTR